jgi:hypothetical protein
MVKQKITRTLIIVCRQNFGGMIERVLRREGFRDFRRGGLSQVGDTAVAARAEASEVFVLTTDVSSAMRLAQILGACPVRGSATDIFEMYTIDHEL